MSDDRQTSPPPAPAPARVITADEYRSAATWDYPIAPGGLVLRFRHLTMPGMMLAGHIPISLVERVSALDGQRSGDIMADPEKRATLVEAARAYLIAASLEPRITETGDEPGTLAIAEIAEDIAVDIFNMGTGRVMEVDPARLGIFRGPIAAARVPAPSDGEGVRAGTESLAAPGAFEGTVHG